MSPYYNLSESGIAGSYQQADSHLSGELGLPESATFHGHGVLLNQPQEWYDGPLEPDEVMMEDGGAISSAPAQAATFEGDHRLAAETEPRIDDEQAQALSKVMPSLVNEFSLQQLQQGHARNKDMEDEPGNVDDHLGNGGRSLRLLPSGAGGVPKGRPHYLGEENFEDDDDDEADEGVDELATESSRSQTDLRSSSVVPSTASLVRLSDRHLITASYMDEGDTDELAIGPLYGPSQRRSSSVAPNAAGQRARMSGRLRIPVPDMEDDGEADELASDRPGPGDGGPTARTTPLRSSVVRFSDSRPSSRLALAERDGGPASVNDEDDDMDDVGLRPPDNDEDDDDEAGLSPQVTTRSTPTRSPSTASHELPPPLPSAQIRPVGPRRANRGKKQTPPADDAMGARVAPSRCKKNSSVALRQQVARNIRRTKGAQVLVYRLANTAHEAGGSGNHHEAGDGGEGEGDEDVLQTAPKFIRPPGVNAVDVLNQLCQELVEAEVQSLHEQQKQRRPKQRDAVPADEDGHQEGMESTRQAQTQAQAPPTAATMRRMRKAIEAFGHELEERCFELTEVLDTNHALSIRVRQSQREKVNLREDLLRIRHERAQLRFKMDAISRQRDERARVIQHSNLVNAWMRDIDLAVQRGRVKQLKERQRKQVHRRKGTKAVTEDHDDEEEEDEEEEEEEEEQGKINTQTIEFWLRSFADVLCSFSTSATTTTFPIISSSTIHSLPTLLPPLPIKQHVHVHARNQVHENSHDGDDNENHSRRQQLQKDVDVMKVDEGGRGEGTERGNNGFLQQVRNFNLFLERSLTVL